MEIQIDGQTRTTVDLSTNEERKPLQLVYDEAGLSAEKHLIKIINRGSGKIAIDALIIK